MRIYVHWLLPIAATVLTLVACATGKDDGRAGYGLTSCPSTPLPAACTMCLTNNCASQVATINAACASYYDCACPVSGEAGVCTVTASCTSTFTMNQCAACAAMCPVPSGAILDGGGGGSSSGGDASTSSSGAGGDDSGMAADVVAAADAMGPSCTNSAQCPTATPVCSQGVCVQCTTNNNCGRGSTPLCMNHVCVAGCTMDSQCPASASHCDPALSQCVQCITSLDCAGTSTPNCMQHVCMP